MFIAESLKSSLISSYLSNRPTVDVLRSGASNINNDHD